MVLILLVILICLNGKYPVSIIFGGAGFGKHGYREGKNDSFTYNKKKYNINCVFEKVENEPIKVTPVSELDWIIKEAPLEDTEEDKKRIEKADLSTAILIAQYGDKLAIIDGMHRLTKAHNNGVKYLPTRFVSDKILEQCEL